MQLRWWPWTRHGVTPEQIRDREALMRSADDVLVKARTHQQALDRYLRGLEEELRRLRGPAAGGNGS